ncbi:MAG TPA: glycosyl hydrolase family 28-related protein [Chthoniobacterales bacterium]|nr:glycosyl hydrolase family 28-related protein [Chthoniobacterales bacterium]
MKLKISHYLCLLVAIATLGQSNAYAVGSWTFTSVRSSFNGLPGAVGDGVANDTAAINRAIAAGTTIYFPPGKYRYVGPMTVPSNISYRFFGDGPGISTIIFTDAVGGINAPSIVDKTFQVDGLTIQGNFGNTGIGINAALQPNNPKFRTVTIRNVEIRGSDRTQNPAGYWGTGIKVYQAQNALIEDVQVHGKLDPASPGPTASVGIEWSSDPALPSTQLFMHDIQVDFYQVAIKTSGWVEGFYLDKFELVFCGYPLPNSKAAMELSATSPSSPGLVFHISDGHVNQFCCGIRLTNIWHAKISQVNFFNQIYDGTHLTLTNCRDVMVTDNNFEDFGISGETNTNGIYSINSTQVRLAGNSIALAPTTTNGSCIVVDSASRKVKILDNTFESSPRQIYDAAPDTYIRLIP